MADFDNINKKTDHVVIVDDDQSNLMVAGRILSSANIHATAVKSGQALLDYMMDHSVDLILLDILMPGMDGFTTLKLLREQENAQGKDTQTPVIFLTADEDEESEVTGLSLGAMDFIKKPFIPEVFLLRVRHIMELVQLQKNLSDKVDMKTKEIEDLFLHVVSSLADAIDAKDTYTNGHSGRVAKYSRMIASKYGYSRKQLDDIYMMGLLHDVGKIGIPDAVINKPSTLTPEEYGIIKNHPVLGDRILKNISEMPSLATGARWHHERYGGGGYPDGLSGEEIPEEARIIAVADAYDAMSSRRSYREVLPQETIRQEIIKGIGTQFDPHFADIMLSIMAEDTNYEMKEQET